MWKTRSSPCENRIFYRQGVCGKSPLFHILNRAVENLELYTEKICTINRPLWRKNDAHCPSLPEPSEFGVDVGGDLVDIVGDPLVAGL